MNNKQMERKPNILIAYAGETTTADIVNRLMNEYAKVRDINIVSKEVLTISADDINIADSVVIIRGADYFLSKIITKAKKVGKQCVFYIDDDLLALYEIGSEFYMYMLTCLRYADILWTSNRNVLNKYSEYVSEGVKCVETVVLDPWDTIQSYQSEVDKVKIVFAGSPSHEQIILKYIYPALQLIHRKHKALEAIFVGYKGTALDGKESYIRTTDWFDNTDEYRKFLKEEKVQIGIGVIEDSNFGRCKFYNKFLEYTKLGIMGIYSNCEPYTFIVKDGENGLLVNNTVEEWAEAIIKTVENPMLREKCVSNAQRLLFERFSTGAVINQIHNEIPELELYKAKKSNVHYNAKLLIYNYLIRRYMRYLSHPVTTVRKYISKKK